MIKKILIGVAVLLVAFVLFFIYRVMNPVSPPDEVKISHNGLELSVTYSRPYQKGRLLFGNQDSEALQPYGIYWRFGADAATQLSVNKDFSFAGEMVSAGTYRMYAVPGKESFEISLNSDLGVFFAVAEPDYSKDVLKLNIPVALQSPPVEQMSIDFAGDSLGVNMAIKWGDLLLNIPISAN